MEKKKLRSIDICHALEKATGKKSQPPTVSTPHSSEVEKFLQDYQIITEESQKYSLQMD